MIIKDLNKVLNLGSLYTSYDTDKESVIDKQDLLKLEIIAFILMTLI